MNQGVTISNGRERPGCSAPNGTVGAAYSGSFAATGGTPPYTFTATGQPATLTMSPAGTLFGTPTLPGTFSVAVTVKDAALYAYFAEAP